MLDVFRELEIRGGNEKKLDKLVAELNKVLPKGWTRDRDRERQVNRYSDTPTQVAYYIARSDSRPAAHLFLIRTPAGYRVSNVVPEQIGQLTRAEYNSFVQDFQTICAPVAEAIGLHLDVTSDKLDISNKLTPRCMKALNAFESMANIGSLHPLDSERWRKFLILAHKDEVDLSAEMLERWLREEHRWPDDRASRLAIEYDHARDLLKDYDGSGT